jgi:hypothetical protein
MREIAVRNPTACTTICIKMKSKIFLIRDAPICFDESSEVSIQLPSVTIITLRLCYSRDCHCHHFPSLTALVFKLGIVIRPRHPSKKTLDGGSTVAPQDVVRHTLYSAGTASRSSRFPAFYGMLTTNPAVVQSALTRYYRRRQGKQPQPRARDH